MAPKKKSGGRSEVVSMEPSIREVYSVRRQLQHVKNDFNFLESGLIRLISKTGQFRESDTKQVAESLHSLANKLESESFINALHILNQRSSGGDSLNRDELADDLREAKEHFKNISAEANIFSNMLQQLIEHRPIYFDINIEIQPLINNINWLLNREEWKESTNELMKLNAPLSTSGTKKKTTKKN